MNTQSTESHDPRCISLKGPYNGCNCWSYGYKPPTHISKIIPTVMEELTMAAALPTVSLDTIDPEVRREIAALDTIKTKLEGRIQKNGITAMIASELQELDTAAKHWLEIKEKQRVEMKKPILEAARKQDTYWGDRMNPVKALRDWCRRGIGTYDQLQRQKADAERREQERLNREAAERQRQAEVDARLAEAAEQEAAGNKDLAAFVLQEAEDAAQAPLIPVATPEVAPAKVEGTSVSYKLIGTVKDPRALLTWLLQGTRDDLMNELVVWSQSGLNAALKRGVPFPEGAIDVVKEPIVRNLSRR